MFSGIQSRFSSLAGGLGKPILGALVLFGLAANSWSQDPPTITLTAKLRDFISIGNPQGLTPTHPHFNGCVSQTKNMVLPSISVNAAGDTTLGDNRNPLVNPSVNVGQACLNPIDRFSDWYNDNSTNRKFKLDLVFNRDATTGQYSYRNTSFFPLDVNGPYTKFDPVNDPNPYGDIFSSAGNHNFGFTMELHTQFTYIKGSHQFFNFQGDDDVWVFVDDSLLIDLGGVHGAITGSFDLDGIQADGRTIAEKLGLVNEESYPLDFFSAERHTTESNIIITTSIKLVQKPQPLSPPIANPAGRTFISDIIVSLTHPLITAGSDSVKIHYTLDGTTPTETSPVYDKTKPLTFIGTTTLKAIAIHSNTKLYLPSAVLTEVYTKSFTASTLEILDANGLTFSSGYITEKATGYTIRLTTTQAGLTSVSIAASTKTGADAETISLTAPTTVGGAFVYSGVVPFSIATAILGDSQTQSSVTMYDSLIVAWTNPKDPTDKPSSKLRVRAAPQQAVVTFSSDSSGTPTTQFVGTESKIYVFVTDEVMPPGTTTNATIATSGLRIDTLTIPLTYLGNNVYRGIVTTQIDGIAKTTDALLQVSVGDQLMVAYLDPQDKDLGTAFAGFGTPALISGKLTFIDKAGIDWIPSVDYNPDEGNIYLRLEDDWAGGSVDSVIVTLSIVNKSGSAPADSEVVVLRRVDASKSGDKVFYEGSIKLASLPNPAKLNGTAETYWRGVVTAKTIGHDKTGTAEPAKVLSAILNVAYPDSKSVIDIKNGDDDTATIDRSTKTIIITLDEQSMSPISDTVFADLKCEKSGDILNHVPLIEVSPGKYVSAPIQKNEGAAGLDNILSCLSDDAIKVSYVDPVHNDRADKTILITDPTTGILYFTKVNSDDHITAVVEEVDSGFVIVIQGKSPNIAVVDNISVKLKVANGEEESFSAIETGPATGIFKVFVPFGFVVGVPTTNGVIEGSLTQVTSNLRVNVAVTAITENNAVTSTITLVAGLVPPTSSYITDINQDGKGDKVVITFPKTLPRIPDSVVVHWNSENSPGVTVPMEKIKFVLGSNNQIIELDMSATPYPDSLSGTGNTPYVQMPPSALFGNKTVGIDDSIPPTILSVIKHPVNVLNITKDDPAFNVDTFVVVLSEPIKQLSVNKSMLRFDLQCGDYSNSKEFKAIEQPILSADGRTLTILVDNTVISPPVNSCIYLSKEISTEVLDIPGNLSVGKAKLKGQDGSKLINGLRGYPPVANLDPNDPKWQVAINDSRNGDDNKKGFATPAETGSGFDLLWIPPADLDLILQGTPNMPKNVNDAGENTIETSAAQPYPFTSGVGGTYNVSGSQKSLPYPISAVQVVTTSKYIVDIAIFDHLGNFVKHQRQSFGFKGELGNRDRVVPGGYASYLVWNMRDKNGAQVGQGVFIWKLTFNFENNRQEVKFVRTGVTRSAN